MAEFDAARARTKRPLPLWVDAFERDTKTFEVDEKGAYLSLLMTMWSTPSLSIPDDPRRLAKAASVSVRLWTNRIGPLLRPLLSEVEGGLTQRRLVREARYVEKQLKSQSERRRNDGDEPEPNKGDSVVTNKPSLVGTQNDDRDAAIKSDKSLTPNEPDQSADTTVDTTAENPRNHPRHPPSQQPNNPTVESPPSSDSLNSPRSSSAPDADDLPNDCSDDDLRLELIHAIGCDRGRVPTYWADPSANIVISTWRTNLGMTPSEIVAAASQSRQNHDTPPDGPMGLNKVMKRWSDAKKNGEALSADPGSRSRSSRPDPDRSYLTNLDFTRKAGGTT